MAHSKSAFQELIFDLQNYQDKESIYELFKACVIPGSEWAQYAYMNDSERGYSRNLVYECEKFRLVLICWKPGSETERHDHNKSDCYFKVLQGTIHEEQCDPNHQLRCEKTYEPGEVCHLESLSGTHCMKTCDAEIITVTLHLYIPPFDRCVVYRNGEPGQNVDNLSFASRFGYATERGSTLLNNL